MDRNAFVLACHDMSLFALSLGLVKSSEAFKALEQQAWESFWWSRSKATSEFCKALRTMFQEKGGSK
jgi:hypothetical protein